ncbi:hypothetical protein ACJX0J_034096, partial [Zea mays]
YNVDGRVFRWEYSVEVARYFKERHVIFAEKLKSVTSWQWSRRFFYLIYAVVNEYELIENLCLSYAQTSHTLQEHTEEGATLLTEAHWYFLERAKMRGFNNVRANMFGICSSMALNQHLAVDARMQHTTKDKTLE